MGGLVLFTALCCGPMALLGAVLVDSIGTTAIIVVSLLLQLGIGLTLFFSPSVKIFFGEER